MLSRRDFLKLVLGGSALLVLPSTLTAEEGYGFIVDRKAEDFKLLDGGKVKCLRCPVGCVIPPGGRGKCRVRENRDGVLYTLVYANPCAVHRDPIEKKPLFHFLPSTYAFSIATAGCNLSCVFCQNWQISQAKPEDTYNYYLSPDQVARLAKEWGCRSIAYTYTEPTVFFEYMYACCVSAHKLGIKNTMHSNGFIQLDVLKRLVSYLDAANIDLKSIEDDFYSKYCGGHVEPVKKAIEFLYKNGVHVEITNLLIPTLNDSPELIKRLVSWVLDAMGPEVPVHFSRFYPMYKLKGLPPTPVETIERALDIAKKEGLFYPYAGNIRGHYGEDTICPGCGKLLIDRTGYYVAFNKIKDGKCPFCGHPIYGVF